MAFDKSTTAEQAAHQLTQYIKGKNVLITGVNQTSLAGEVAKVLASLADKIIILGRSLERAQATVDFHGSNAEIHFVPFDLLSLASVSKTTAEVVALGIPIHVVICSALIPLPRELVRTEEGFEGQFAGSHLAHFKLVSGIMPALRAGRAENLMHRIVMVSSNGHLRATSASFEDPALLEEGHKYDRYQAYADAKLANILFAREFSRRYAAQGLEAVSLHPGAIRETGARDVFTDEEWARAGLMNPDGSLTEVGKRDIKSRAQGAGTLIVGAFDPTLREFPGSYLTNNKVVPPSDWGTLSPLGHNDEMAAQLWAVSEALVGSPFDADGGSSAK